ncbi:hypothetical protein ACWGM0_10540 [Sphingomonas bisphenolicum]
MILQNINIGTVANDNTGDDFRSGASKINANNALISAALGDDANFAATMATALAGKQPLDSDLSAIAALSTTSFGRGLLTMADGPAAVAAIGAQALDADLTAIAGLTTTAWGRALLTLADAAALRSLLGCGYVIHQSAVNSAVTGTTTETTLATFTIPANSIGPNGSAEFMLLAGYTNSVNTKTLRIRVNGTQVLAITLTTTASGQFIFTIANRGAVNSQVANASSFPGISGAGGSEQTFSFDTTADLTVTITGQLTNTGEEIRLARRRCIIYPGA